ncbi:LPS export ABC transporter periplasmic protein LptC [Pyruvatibacter sp.]|uniref:LPS export ABC transporter periplasmic protein LptC n=1 Tax=Pyruvatibacter sp. TaxID=1981328 RepID=UPI0032633082
MSLSGTSSTLQRRTTPSGQRKQANAASAKAYSRFVSAMKLGLALTAAILIVALLLLSGTFDGPDELDITFSEVTSRTDDLRMVSPRISDIDDEGQPYTITATSAVQDADNPGLIHLDNVQGDLISATQSSWTSVTSEGGLLNTDEEWIDLEKDVMLFTDGGFQFQGDIVRIDLASGDISSDTPVFAQGPDGTAEGGGLRVTESGNTITLINGAKVVIFDAGGGGSSSIFGIADE